MRELLIKSPSSLLPAQSHRHADSAMCRMYVSAYLGVKAIAIELCVLKVVVCATCYPVSFAVTGRRLRAKYCKGVE
jgi:hypothetical protein